MEIETTRGRFDVIDEGKGTTLVLVHGFPFDAGAWRADVTALSPRMRVIAPTMRGFGATRADASEPLTIDGMADDVAAIVAAIDVPGPIVIGGISMGGYVAMAFARKYGEVLRGVILADTAGEPDDEAALAALEQGIAQVERGDLSGFVDGFLESVLSPDTRSESPAVAKQMRDMMMKAKPASVASALRALHDKPEAMSGLSEVSVPALVIVGEHDVTTPPAAAKALVAAMAETRTQLVIIPKAGHFSNLEQPAAFCKAVTSFIATL